MKHLVVGSCDFIIKSRAVANVKEDKSTDWVDKEALTANGRYMPENILFYAEQHDEYGNLKLVSKVWLSVNDIKILAQKIKEIETIEQVVTIDDYLPY